MATKFLSAAEATANRAIALHSYRHLLRATGLAFRDDKPIRTAARAQARHQFESSRTVTPGSVEASQAIDHAQGVTKILRENVVQGKRIGDEGERYKLRMHEHTQRMDNDVAGTLKGTTKSFKQISNERF